MTTPMETADTSLALVRKAKSGDRHAFERLLESYGGRVRALIASRLKAREMVTVEVDDVLQEALLRSYRAIGGFEWQGEDSFLRWVGGIIDNVIREISRRGARKPVFRLEHDVSDEPVSPSRAMRREERLDRLHGALNDLVPEYREVIVLSRIEGRSFDEIAERMGRSPNAVKQLLWRALKKLKESFGDTESLNLPRREFKEGRNDDHRE